MDMRVLLWTVLVMTAVMTCTHTLFLPALFSLVVMGIVPGTSLRVPTALMLIVYPTLFIVGIYWLSTLQLFVHEAQSTHVRKAPYDARKKSSGHIATRPMTASKRRRQQTA